MALTIYRASAGAGKTHKLTGEYLTLLFAHPQAYRKILAVTFTNKATDEMKRRIIEELYQLSSGERSAYLSALAETYTLSETDVRRQAQEILIRILHDYSSFNISTIDRFFQQTMRAFTREIGLQGGYGIEMDQELVLTEVIDSLLAGLERPEQKPLLGWLLRFAEEKIESGGQWNLRKDITELSRELFKESYKAFSEEVIRDIKDKESLDDYLKTLYTMIRSVEQEMRTLGEEGLVLLRRFGLEPTDFKGGSRSPLLFFERLAKGETKPPSATFIALADHVEGCYTKTTDPEIREAIIRTFEGGLNKHIQAIIHRFSDLTAYFTAKEITRYSYTLGILSDISRQLAVYREEKNILLIADTTELLNKVIDGSDAPFIYEKTGTMVDHYMIDEFQDTSGMQWANFRPLIEESLAHERTNLIVGDVKQSIYRFRNSDWKLLDEQLYNDFPSRLLRKETLRDNWRSGQQIVAFNNALFHIAPLLLQQTYNEQLESSPLFNGQSSISNHQLSSRILSAYSDSQQQSPSAFRTKGGHVRIEFLPQTDETSDWKTQALERLPEILGQLQTNGYQLKDIAILTRTNQEGALVADKLLTYSENHPDDPWAYDIISDEALLVGSSPAVRLMVALLRHLKNPEDQTARQLAELAYRATNENLSSSPHKKGNLSSSPLERGQGVCHEPQASPLLRGVGSVSRATGEPSLFEGLTSHSLYETTETIYRLLSDQLPENEQVFIQAFFDQVADFSRKEQSDIDRFLTWWDETGYKKAIATPDGQNAIRILTIHKSKGLGFKVVILPFGEWEIDHKAGKPVILWCHPKEAPFDRLQLVPVRYGQTLSQTIFAGDYFNEKLHASIDNLNTLYVALTRAKEELILLSPRPKKIDEKTGEIEKTDSISTLLWNSLVTTVDPPEQKDDFTDLTAHFDAESGLFESGTWQLPPQTESSHSDNEELTTGRLSSATPNDRLSLRLHGKGFFFDQPQRKHGALMHDVLSRIHTRQDIPRAVEGFRQMGMIDQEEAMMITEQLQQLLDRPVISKWFDGSATVLNEVDILFDKTASRRPDRVVIKEGRATVIDYKFGEHKEQRHRRQVAHYMKLIGEMGYKEVEGYLWYVELNQIDPV
ncbi:UvrD-helicase domain-containing protein [Parabacteroides sp. PF5-9]|uniref:UvrD-helicase domain-containing protein n=1 Tax=Parabacteroides sp. PF5-9 TaxID=1742404 RepID=UPI002475735C|nr:UvrD-helicase domain-containing protein [Parabacteroides sp. PF5-9]MDH6356687.1 ATP-dependent helicase/nuclease subunit A [Parabacteroides sp. PF5-9]